MYVGKARPAACILPHSDTMGKQGVIKSHILPSKSTLSSFNLYTSEIYRSIHQFTWKDCYFSFSFYFDTHYKSAELMLESVYLNTGWIDVVLQSLLIYGHFHSFPKK